MTGVGYVHAHDEDGGPFGFDPRPPSTATNLFLIPVLVVENARIIDGTGDAPQQAQTTGNPVESFKATYKMATVFKEGVDTLRLSYGKVFVARLE